MGFHNPFLKDGLLVFPDNGSVVRHVENGPRCVATSSPTDSSTSRPSAMALTDLNWAQSSASATAPSAPACSR